MSGTVLRALSQFILVSALVQPSELGITLPKLNRGAGIENQRGCITCLRFADRKFTAWILNTGREIQKPVSLHCGAFH